MRAHICQSIRPAQKASQSAGDTSAKDWRLFTGTTAQSSYHTETTPWRPVLCNLHPSQSPSGCFGTFELNLPSKNRQARGDTPPRALPGSVSRRTLRPAYRLTGCVPAGPASFSAGPATIRQDRFSIQVNSSPLQALPAASRVITASYAPRFFCDMGVPNRHNDRRKRSSVRLGSTHVAAMGLYRTRSLFHIRYSG